MLQEIYVRNPDVVYRRIADEVILVPIKRQVGDLSSIYTLNESAFRVWELLDGVNTVSQIENELLGEYDVSSEEVRHDLQDLLTSLIKSGCVKEIN